jgi:hypothetical protein
MKLSPGLFLEVVASLAIVAALSSTASAQNAATRNTSVTALAGDVRYSKAGAGFVPVPVGAKLNEGDAIKTGPSSHVDVDLGGNVGLIQLAPSSTLVVRTIKATQTQADTVTETDLDLKAGTVYFKANKLSKASRYEITTPKGIAGIRGTAGSVNSDGQVTLTEGMAGTAYPTNNGAVETYIVRGGETVGPTDKPPHPATGEALQGISDALNDAATHGIALDFRPSVIPKVENTFISPTLPGH